jgi:GNAT superfamily N-acetyltransferase
MKLIKNEEKYYEFIRILRTHKNNISGFVKRNQITPEQHAIYMNNHKDNYYICLNDNNEPVGWVGNVNDDIRICTHPDHKNKGFGKFMINELTKIYPVTYAKILLDNKIIEKTLKSCGYKLYKQDNKFKYYIKVSDASLNSSS